MFYLVNRRNIRSNDLSTFFQMVPAQTPWLAKKIQYLHNQNILAIKYLSEEIQISIDKPNYYHTWSFIIEGNMFEALSRLVREISLTSSCINPENLFHLSGKSHKEILKNAAE